MERRTGEDGAGTSGVAPVNQETGPGSEDVSRLLDELASPVAGVLVSSGAFFTGVALLLDDAKDFGKLSSTFISKDPPLPHHWLIGTLIMMGGIAGMGFSLLRLMQENPPPLKMPQSLVEGMNSRTLEKYK